MPTTDSYDCKVSCNGLYADVHYTDDVPVRVTESESEIKALATEGRS